MSMFGPRAQNDKNRNKTLKLETAAPAQPDRFLDIYTSSDAW